MADTTAAPAAAPAAAAPNYKDIRAIWVRDHESGIKANVIANRMATKARKQGILTPELRLAIRELYMKNANMTKLNALFGIYMIDAPHWVEPDGYGFWRAYQIKCKQCEHLCFIKSSQQGTCPGCTSHMQFSLDDGETSSRLWRRRACIARSRPRSMAACPTTQTRFLRFATSAAPGTRRSLKTWISVAPR